MLGWYTRALRSVRGALGSNSRISHNLERNRPFVDGNFKSNVLPSLIRVGFVSAAATALYYRHTEPVPYTGRRHFLLRLGCLEKLFGDSMAEQIRSEYKGKILASDHPSSIRVEKIGRDIVEVVKSQLKEKIEWEFVVVDEPTIVNANVWFGGKIVIFTGLLNLFSEDDEVATVIAHEVGHTIARHAAEDMMKFGYSKFFRFSVYDDDETIQELRLFHNQRLPVHRRRELEADYIGLVLMASAGYDPRVAPHVYKKLDDEGWVDFLTRRPEIRTDEAREKYITGETRVQQLLQPKVMEKALSIYKEVLAKSG